MSRLGVTSGRPWAGLSTLLADSMSTLASAWDSADSGRCTAIWSPSKSALKAAHTSGWIWIALPSTSTGSKAWMPSRCRVGARLSNTGCSWMASSRTSHTCGRRRSTMRLADLMLGANSASTSFFMTKGLNSSRAMILGSPHCWKRSVGPTTITDRPE